MINRIPVFLQTDNNYAPQTAVTMLSCLKHTSAFIEFYILDASITDDSKNKISITLKKYKNFSVEYISVDIRMFDDFSATESYLNKTAYLRLLIPLIKPELDRVIYSDVDVLFMGDITELWNTSLDGHTIAAVQDAFYLVEKGANDIYPRLKLSNDHNYFFSGLLLIDCQQWRKKNLTEKVFDIAKTEHENIIQADQDILNIMFNNNDYKILDIKYEVTNFYIKYADKFPYWMDSIRRPVIRHYESGEKPWNSRKFKGHKMKHFYSWWQAAYKTPFFPVLKNIFKTARRKHNYFWPFYALIIKARSYSLRKPFTWKFPLELYIGNNLPRNNEISFVIQGVLHPEITPLTIKSIRRFFPGAEIVIGTYIGSDTTGLDYDKIALVEDPGYYPAYDMPGAFPHNINRQIQTTLAGLKTATRKYAFKLRTDFILTGNGFLEFWGKFPKFDPKYRIFEEKILSCVFFARNPRVEGHPYAFCPSDIAFFGLRTDLINLFDVPFMTKEDSTYYPEKEYRSCRYTPEQHLWLGCLRKNGKDIDFDYKWDSGREIADETEKYAVSNFIYLDWTQFCLEPPGKLMNFVTHEHNTCITHIEWQKLYKQYLDNELVLPLCDPTREFLNKQYKINKEYKILARLIALFRPLVVFLIPYPKVRRKIKNYLRGFLKRL